MTSLVRRSSELLAPQLDYILVDGSGSMIGKWPATKAALRQFCDVLRSENVASHGIMHVFDNHDREQIVRDDVLANWPHNFDDVRPTWGFTPLYDAIGIMGWRLKDLAPSRCSVVIVTDGEESGRQDGSRTYNVDQARAILDWCRAQGWSVTFLGADFNNAAQARLLGADESNALGVRKELLAESGKLLGRKRAHYGRTGEEINFSEDERQQFGGYLTHG